ncbi:MAG: hypothetical protein JSV65_00635 [Armatimonadota bacterium]|nr:MAG: hypothetical protein JSV65_00635 [Armatimonadota bacterium]
MTFNFEPYVEFCRRRAAMFRRIAIGVALFGSALFWLNFGVDLARGEPFIHTSRVSSLVCAVSFVGAAVALYLDLRASRAGES